MTELTIFFEDYTLQGRELLLLSSSAGICSLPHSLLPISEICGKEKTLADFAYNLGVDVLF